MVTRLGAALCGAAMVMASFSAATAKSANPSLHHSSSKKTASRNAAHAQPHDKTDKTAAAEPTNPPSGRAFVPGKAPFPCARPELGFADRFRPAQRLIANALLTQPKLDAMGNPVAPLYGTASMYNPYRPGYKEGGIETASGELYDPAAWTAAIQADFRGMFGGVHYGKNYKAAYALLESAGKKVIVKINDVGPLTPGRVIDLNQQAMHYFDPSLQRGLISDIKITPLPGQGWVSGPVDERVFVTQAEQISEQTAEPSVY
ncbi:MAG: septal ring lytic transglycosylase RlpA family protein [Pseudolabrys sp.]